MQLYFLETIAIYLQSTYNVIGFWSQSIAERLGHLNICTPGKPQDQKLKLVSFFWTLITNTGEHVYVAATVEYHKHFLSVS